MPERELDELIKEHLTREVRAHRERLVGMESRVLQEIMRPRAPTAWGYPLARWGLAFAASRITASSFTTKGVRFGGPATLSPYVS